MIAGFEPFSVGGIGFAMLAAAVIAAAWLPQTRVVFPWILSGTSFIMVLTWGTLADLSALLFFVVPPYFIIQWRWGRPDRDNSSVVFTVLACHLLLFIFLRGYGPVNIDRWLDNPITVVGISYILFRQIHLIIDAPYIGDLQLTPVRYGTYLLAFWTFLAGPIQRYEDFTAGLTEISRPSMSETLTAGHRTVNGLILAFLIAPLFLPTQDLALLRRPEANWLDFIVVFYSFPLFLYLNFTGYTDVMIGISRLCGMTTMPENFNRPFLARNIQDFWARWHISLSTWIGQYVFNPLNAAALRRTDPVWHKPIIAVILFITFFVVGMWHGTTVNFFIFGMLHAAGVLITSLYDGLLNVTLGRERKRRLVAYPAVHWSAVFLCVNYVCLTMFVVNYDLAELLNTMRQFLGLAG